MTAGLLSPTPQSSAAIRRLIAPPSGEARDSCHRSGSSPSAGLVLKLPAARDVSVFAQLPVHGIKNGLAGASQDQALPEDPDRRSVRYLAARAQSHKALEGQAVKQLEFQLLIAEVEWLFDRELSNCQLRGEWRTPASLAAPRSQLPAPTRCQGCSTWLRVLRR